MVYLPPHFTETDLPTLHDLIAANPLGTLITLAADGLEANHIPCMLDSTAGEKGRLLAHVARNNPLWREHPSGQQALVIFQTANAYISPTWYETKHTTHEVVPTWNYAVVHAHGPLIVHDDVKWIRGQAGMLTKQMEANQPQPWKMSDAPLAFTESQLRAIVGIEIPIARLTGKFKMGQNRDEADVDGAVSGLRATNQSDNLAVAAMMEHARRER